MAYNYCTGNLSCASSPNPTPRDLRDPAETPRAPQNRSHPPPPPLQSRHLRHRTPDTDLQDVTELLPTPNHTVFIGQKPPEKSDAFRPPFLVIVNNKDGAITTHPL